MILNTVQLIWISTWFYKNSLIPRLENNPSIVHTHGPESQSADRRCPKPKLDYSRLIRCWGVWSQRVAGTVPCWHLSRRRVERVLALQSGTRVSSCDTEIYWEAKVCHIRKPRVLMRPPPPSRPVASVEETCGGRGDAGWRLEPSKSPADRRR